MQVQLYMLKLSLFDSVILSQEIYVGAEEMAGQLRAHPALADDPGLIPRTHIK